MEIVTSIMGLMGGIALFLYAMKMISGGLETVAGNQLKTILQKLTSNRFLGVFMGALITALVQSSTTTTVMVVGFVNAKLMDLYQALWIIMGSNIGTNITSQLIAFDVSAFAPLIAVAGIIFIFAAKNKRVRSLGDVITGIGFIFIGMEMMTSSMTPLIELPFVKELVVKMENPFLGILCGIILVFITQSSAAGVGLLQAMAMASVAGTAVASNSITLNQAIFILFGLNIGTCFHALLSAIGGKREALRASMLHMLFNVIGTVIFTPCVLLLPFTDFISKLSPDDVARQIANAHLFFNVGTTVILLPLGGFLVKLVVRMFPDKVSEEDGAKKLVYLESSMLKSDSHKGMSSVLVNACYEEVVRMYEMALVNVSKSLNAVLENSEELQSDINEREEYIDYLNKEISFYISHGLGTELEEDDILKLNSLFKITGNIERMGDHATNIAGYANMMQEKDYHFSDTALNEVREMIRVVTTSSDKILDLSVTDVLSEVSADEQLIDDMTLEYRANQLQRMASGSCSGETCVIYSEMLTDFERLGDHLLNIAEEIARNEIRTIKCQK